jgi:hypothetical protein
LTERVVFIYTINYLTETVSPSSQPAEPTHTETWDTQDVATDLLAQAATVQDATYGDGLRVPFGEGRTIEIYPATGTARITTQETQVEVSANGVSVTPVNPDHPLQFTGSSGTIIFPSTLHNSTEQPSEPFLQPIDTQIPDTRKTPARSAPMASETAAEKPAGKPGVQPKAKEDERVEIVGRVGRKPTYKDTGKVKLLKFPLAEHPDSETTKWHTVVAFGSRAEKLKDSLTKGEEVKIAGYEKERYVQSRKGGEPKKVKEIFLAALTHVEKPR